MIDLRNVTKVYQMGDTEYPALKGISFKIGEGELVALVGSSGSGKTTTMNIIGLLDRPTSGEYYLNKQEVSTISKNKQATLRNKTIGFVFQSFFLLPRLNALQNVGLPLMYRGLGGKEMKERAQAMLDRVDVGKLSHHKPSELSGGQQQRVAIARALVGHPKIVLADEPTGALDSKTGQDVLDLLKELNQEEKTTVIVITHDEKIATQCSRIIKLHDGLIVE